MIFTKKFQLFALIFIAVSAATGFFLFKQPTTAGLTGDRAILEDAGHINLALQISQNGRGPSIIGDPTAVYGKIMKYEDTVGGFGSLVVSEGESQAWKSDRLVYVYLLEGDFASTRISSDLISDWAQTILIIDAETGTLMRTTTHRLAGKIDTSQFITLAVRESTKGVPARDVTSLDRPVEIPVAAATPAPRDTQSR